MEGDNNSRKNSKYILCPYYISGHCKYGTNCVYSHIPEDALRKTTMCKFWLQRKCYNEHCDFAHGNEELKPQRMSSKFCNQNNQIDKLRQRDIASVSENCNYTRINLEMFGNNFENLSLLKQCNGVVETRSAEKKKKYGRDIYYSNNNQNNKTKKYNNNNNKRNAICSSSISLKKKNE